MCCCAGIRAFSTAGFLPTRNAWSGSSLMFAAMNGTWSRTGDGASPRRSGRQHCAIPNMPRRSPPTMSAGTRPCPMPSTAASPFSKTSRRAGFRSTRSSNWNGEKFRETRSRFAFLDHFRDIVVSGDARLVKPDPAIYRLLLERNGLPAGRLPVHRRQCCQCGGGGGCRHEGPSFPFAGAPRRYPAPGRALVESADAGGSLRSRSNS